ncbi:MAG: hypothetical protein JNJ60_02315 [Rhodocyclaceae bacterium]|nr:hypothetical protein [Rhodocyclaceae bacterium]
MNAYAPPHLTQISSAQPAACPGGKSDTALKVWVPGQLKDGLTALAHLRGLTLSEYVREVLTTHAYGHLPHTRGAGRAGPPRDGG